jgi:hypothetical protein
MAAMAFGNLRSAASARIENKKSSIIMGYCSFRVEESWVYPLRFAIGSLLYIGNGQSSNARLDKVSTIQQNAPKAQCGNGATA